VLEPIPANGTVHWLGAGLSTGSGLRVICDLAERVVLWARTEDKARRRLISLGLPGNAAPAAFDLASLETELRAGDIVVSMLPAAQHAALLRMCIARRAHFACSSYVSDAILAAAQPAGRARTVVLTEAGLDPGIDHLLAHMLVARGQEATGEAAATADFMSYCGGLPAVANAFRYRFSWAPHGVLAALCEPARYLDQGVTKVAERPWEATRPHVLAGETFEVYPNRDSIPFVSQYGIPQSWRLRTFVRGTLRLDGWRNAWADVFTELRTGDADRRAALADELAARYPATSDDRDRVVLAVALNVRGTAGGTWSGEYLLDIFGDEMESAMARCVSLPLSFGVAEMLRGRMPAGLRRAAGDAAEAQRWLAFLAGHGINPKFSQSRGLS
jgi:hypothetical protein